MLIAILSDIHDHREHLSRALAQARGAEVLLCLGDLCSPFIADDLGQGFTGPIHVTFGNNDGDTFRITQVAARYAQMTLHGEFAELELGGLTFCINHFDHIGRALARGGAFDVVCYGHNHEYEDRHSGKTRILNPGEVYGLRKGAATFMLFDTESREVRRIDL